MKKNRNQRKKKKIRKKEKWLLQGAGISINC